MSEKEVADPATIDAVAAVRHIVSEYGVRMSRWVASPVAGDAKPNLDEFMARIEATLAGWLRTAEDRAVLDAADRYYDPPAADLGASFEALMAAVGARRAARQ